MSNTHIDWSKYFDRIYCVHYLPQRERLPRLKDELKRVGILDSGVFELRYTSDSPYDEIIFKNLEYSHACVSTTNINIGLEIRRILAEAMEFGYKRILLLESDIAFLKSLEELKDALDSLPPDGDVVQLDKFVNLRIKGEYQGHLRENMVNKWYFTVPTRAFYTSAACMALSAKAIASMKRVLDAHIEAIDICPQVMLDCTRYVAAKNLAIQIFYANSNNTEEACVKNMHDVYTNAALDYADYNVPEEYSKRTLMKDKDNKFTVSVYAIALNEEKCAERWYNCFKEADELCVLDTGSTDRTVEILQNLGVKVTRVPFIHWNTLEEYDQLDKAGRYPWRFDRARNMAMRTCNPHSTLLYCTDIDDMVEPGWKERMRKLWEKGCDDAAKLGRKPMGMAYNYEVDWSKYGNNQNTQNFSRHNIHVPKGWQWRQPCHEVLEHESNNPLFVACPTFKMRSVTEVKEHKEYLPLLELNAREYKDDPRALHLLGREYCSIGRYDDAIVKLTEHINHPKSKWNCERAASMRFIAESYKAKKDPTNQELWLWRAMAEDPKGRDYPYDLGCLLLRRKDYALAESVLRKCVAIEKPNLEYPHFNLESFSELPYLHLAEALYYQGKMQEAIQYAQKATELKPDSKMAQLTLEEITRFSKTAVPDTSGVKAEQIIVTDD